MTGTEDYGGPERRAPLQLADRRQGERRDGQLAVHLTEQVVILAAEQWYDALDVAVAPYNPDLVVAAEGLAHAVRAYKAARAILAPDMAGTATLAVLCWLGAALAAAAMTQLGVGSWPRFAAGLVACALLVFGGYLSRVARDG